MATRYTQEMDMEAWERYVGDTKALGPAPKGNTHYLPVNVATLAALLEDAKNAHTIYAPADENWPRWYAEWILGLRDEKGKLR